MKLENKCMFKDLCQEEKTSKCFHPETCVLNNDYFTPMLAIKQIIKAPCPRCKTERWFKEMPLGFYACQTCQQRVYPVYFDFLDDLKELGAR